MQPENYLVIDFEATCCDVGTIARENMEIIEFGVVMVEAEGFQDYDLKQLRQDCEFNKVPYPISAPHINVKRQMADIQKLSKKFLTTFKKSTTSPLSTMKKWWLVK